MKIVFLSLMFLVFSFDARASELTSSDLVQQRMAKDIANEKPLIAHVIVALCDNKYQGIVPVPEQLGDGDNPRTNLYWGALYGVKTYFSRHDHWSKVKIEGPQKAAVLDRVAFKSRIRRGKEMVNAILIAEAWQGREIEAATARFLRLSGGEPEESYTIGSDDDQQRINGGGASHMIIYVGHNGLMDFNAPPISKPPSSSSPRSSVVLACKSNDYFAHLLQSQKSHSLLTTNGLMAPEAYTLEAAITAWFSGKSPDKTHKAASDTYAQYQKANKVWAYKLFSSQP